MLDQKFIDRIEELRHHTYSRITDLQRNLCPMVKDIFMNYQFEYWYEGYKYNLWQDNKHLYAVKELPYCYDNELKNTTFVEKLDKLIEESKVWPMLLFIDGVAIQWSKIVVIHDYDYTYLMINDIVPDYSITAKIVVFPINYKEIRYGEDNDVLTTPDRKGFYFYKGLRVEKTDLADIDLRLEIRDPDIYYRLVNVREIQDGHLTFDDLPDGYIPTLENILMFNEDGTFHSNGPIDKIDDCYKGAFGLFKLLHNGNEEIKWAIMMYNTAGSKEMLSMYDRMDDLNRKNIVQMFKENTVGTDIWNKVITPLMSVFDFEHDQEKSYEDNIANATKYITRYDFRLWKDAFLKDLNIKSFYFTGARFKRLADDKGYIHVSRHHGEKIEDVAIMFVNHKLYRYMIDITYTNNTINLPIFSILDEDHVEVLLFTKCNNNILDISVRDRKTPVYIHPEYNLEDCYIMSDYCPDAEYTVPENVDGRKQYIVDFSYTVKDSMYTIQFDNKEYYDMPLKIVPKRQFRYYRYKQKDDQYKVILPTQFNYCHDLDRYLIFINGKKIDKNEYTITVMNKNRPFDRLILYFGTLLDNGDYVDIFYIPEIIVEKYKQVSMPKNGLLMLEDTTEKANYPTTYPMTKDTVMFFVNGLKVNPLDIKDIDLNTVLINTDDYRRYENGEIELDGDLNPIRNRHQVTAIDNITLMEFVPGNKEISGYLEGLYEQIPEGEPYDPDKINFNTSVSDAWKNLIKVILSGDVKGVDLKTLFGHYFEIENPEESYKKNFTSLKAILYDAIIEFYLTTQEATTGGPFVYDFERDYFENETQEVETKHINLFPDKDKMLDYFPLDTIAQPEDVTKDKTFRDGSI